MNGPEHYAEAERLIKQAMGGSATPLWNRDPATAGLMAAAQVHATLALAAATIETAASRGPGDVSEVWVDVLSPADARTYHSPDSLGPG